MTFSQRVYQEETDQIRMLELAQHCSTSTLHRVDLPYRFSSWALDDPQNAVLWFNKDQQLAGWAVLQTPFWTIDAVCDPAVENTLLPEILAWADARARSVAGSRYERPAWFVMAFKEQAGWISALEKAGFQCQADVGEDSWSKVLMQRSSHEPVKIYQPPEGYTIRPLAGENEVEAYVELHRAVFESKNMTVDWRIRTLHQPSYRPDLDIVVQAPDGRLAAFCICWLSQTKESGLEGPAQKEYTLEGHVEPLGNHKDFRHFGLGRVALSEGLHRLKALGVQNIFVETDNYRNTAFQLYESFDFKVIRDVLVFRKDYKERENR